MNIFVGNLSYTTVDEDLRQAFERHGAVTSARVINDRETQRSRGFGFVEMPNDDEGRKAIEALNGFSLGGRDLRVNEARPREERPPRSGGGGGYGDRPQRSGGGGGDYGDRPPRRY
jgi:RNA recognition motif-containing protein